MKRKNKNDKKNNLIFLVFMVIILLGLVLLSFHIKPKNDKSNELFTFNIADFQYISPIDLEMFKASLYSEETSIIFVCINESGLCYDEVNALNDIAKNYKLNIEYMNILELTNLEIKELQEQNDIFDSELYPNLLIINKNKIVDNNNNYLNQDEIINFFKKNNIL